ncbi:acetyltransferase GNAT family [Pseudohyphozyma bogoriensis]|nr:acetyltransferase GNAT family [Pseudohyphozyma bogoriensis]
MTVELSPVTLEDLPEVVRIQRESFFATSRFMQEAFGPCQPADIDAASIARFTPKLTDASEALIKATRGGGIVGFAYWSLPRWDGSGLPETQLARPPPPPGAIVSKVEEFSGAIKARAEELSGGPPFYRKQHFRFVKCLGD